MKKTKSADHEKLQALLENLELPKVQMPAHQRRLREILLVCGCFEKENAFYSTHQKISGGIKMKSKTLVSWRLVASLLVVVLALGAYAAFFTAPQAVASLTLQVNPVVTLTLDRENNVIDIKGLDSEGEALLAGLNVTGLEVSASLRTIAETMRGAGFLGLEQEIVLVLHTIEGRLAEPALITLADTVRQTLDGYLTEQGLLAEVKVAVVTAELVDVANDIGLLPADYIDLVDAVGAPIALQVLNLQKELDLDQALFKEELSTIAAALIDMKEAGIAADNALVILKGALAADPKLEELSTITAAMVDLHEAGATQEDIMALFNLAEGQIAAGIDRILVLEEITTITAAKVDLLEAGIPAAAALAAIKTAMVADPKLEELTTITAAMIDLTEKGLSKEEALAKVQAAIKADPTLKNFDDLIEIPEAAANRVKPDEKPKAEEPEAEKPNAKKPEAEKPKAVEPKADQNIEAAKPKPGEPKAKTPEKDGDTVKPESDMRDADKPDGAAETR